VIEQEPETLPDLLVGYVAILAAIPEVARFVGQSFIGGYAPLGQSLIRAVVVYLVTFAMVYIIAGVIDLLAPRFGGEKNFANAVKLSVYSHTPLWLAGICLLIPGLNFLLILGVYGVYLLWTGLPLLMRVPTEKALYPNRLAALPCILGAPAIRRSLSSFAGGFAAHAVDAEAALALVFREAVLAIQFLVGAGAAGNGVGEVGKGVQVVMLLEMRISVDMRLFRTLWREQPRATTVVQ